MNSSVNKNSLNKIAEQYHLNPVIADKEFDEQFHQCCFDWVKSEISDSKKVLELGYGEGNMTRQLLDAGKEVEIIEGAKLLVDTAKALYGESVKIHHSLFADFHPECDYDVILATNILEHVGNPVETLQSIRQWSKPWTRIFITVPNAESIHRRLAVQMGIQPRLDTLSPRDHLVGHQRVYSLDQLSAEVESSGFRIILRKGFQLKVLPNSLLRNLSSELNTAFYTVADQLDIRYLAHIGVILVPDENFT